MGTEGEQAVLEEDPPALLSPHPLPFDQLGLLPLFFHLSRSAQTREEGETRDCPTFRRTLAAAVRSGRFRKKYHPLLTPLVSTRNPLSYPGNCVCAAGSKMQRKDA